MVSNESADCLALLHELAPDRALRPTDDDLCAEMQRDVNDGVYRCGFATSQRAYDEAERRLFSALDECERRLRDAPFLCGETVTEADVRLFPTALRLDPVYAVLFRVCRKSVRHDYPAIGAWLARMYALPGVAETCDIDATRTQYYTSLSPLNPGGIVPATPMPSLAPSQSESALKEHPILRLVEH